MLVCRTYTHAYAHAHTQSYTLKIRRHSLSCLPQHQPPLPPYQKTMLLEGSLFRQPAKGISNNSYTQTILWRFVWVGACVLACVCLSVGLIATHSSNNNNKNITTAEKNRSISLFRCIFLVSKNFIQHVSPMGLGREDEFYAINWLFFWPNCVKNLIFSFFFSFQINEEALVKKIT